MLLGLGGLLLAGTALADEPPVGDPVAGKKIASQCRTCHGIDGYARIPIAPHIGGEPASYLHDQLTAFRDGTRTHEMMSVVARMLTDEQIDDLAAWYAYPIAPFAAAPEACTACHGVDGIALIEDAPNLAGESNIYIDTQLKAFRLGKRTHEVMSAVAEDMTDAEIRAVADWYANVKLEITVPD